MTDTTETLMGMVPTVVAVGVVDRAARMGSAKRTRARMKKKEAIIKSSEVRKERIAVSYAQEVGGMSKKEAYKYLFGTSPKTGKSKNNWKRW
jgi:hypothetical protein